MEHTEDEMIRCDVTDCKYRGKGGKCEADVRLTYALLTPERGGRYLSCNKYEKRDGVWEGVKVIRRAIEE